MIFWLWFDNFSMVFLQMKLKLKMKMKMSQFLGCLENFCQIEVLTWTLRLSSYFKLYTHNKGTPIYQILFGCPESSSIFFANNNLKIEICEDILSTCSPVS